MNKKATLEEVRRIIGVVGAGGTLNRTHDEFLFMEGLLKRHPHAAAKIGVGVKGFRVVRTKWGQLGFEVIRQDESVTDFSFMKCITTPSHEALVKKAMRSAVAHQTWEFKWSVLGNGGAFCPIKGIRLTQKNAHVDHAPPYTFDRLVLDFLSSENIEFSEVKILASADGKMGERLVDEKFTNRWCAFHKERAHLRLISDKANLSGPKNPKWNDPSF